MKTGIIFGCWDLFHVGHLNVLKRAAIRCDELYVGVFTNNIVKSYKKVLPIIAERNRLKIIQHINLGPSCVVRGILINHRRPAAWNADYFFASEKLIGKPLVMVNEKFKGQIVYLPYTFGVSTSAIKDVIRISWGVK